jgi:nitrite reductase (cytochrome c-552)
MSNFKNRFLNFYRSRPLTIFSVLVLLAALGAVGGMFLLVSVFQHKQEARNPFFQVVELTNQTEDPAIWGKNFPMQYDDYRRTTDQVRTRYGGSEAMPRTPTHADRVQS